MTPLTDLERAELYSPAALLAQFELAEEDRRALHKALFKHCEDAEPELFVTSRARKKMRKADAAHVGYSMEAYLLGARTILKVSVNSCGGASLGRNFMDFYVDYLTAFDGAREAFHLVLLDRLNALELKEA